VEYAGPGDAAEAYLRLLAEAELRRAAALPHPTSEHQDGPSGLAPVAAVLPEIDGARFVLAGMTSGERAATLNVFSWGWRPRPRTFRLDQPLSWRARDNAGRWHLGRVAPADGPHFHLELVPPLNLAATELGIMLTGTSSRASATVPLAWAGR
jgi:hypothetical protein